jgi:hypothetical protein
VLLPAGASPLEVPLDCCFEVALPLSFCVELVALEPLFAEAALLTPTPTAIAMAPAPAAARIPVLIDTLLSMPLRRRSAANFLVLFTVLTCPAQLRSGNATTLHSF